MKGNPFTEADLQRPADEGRSLHDEVRSFLEVKMGLKTPITASNLPKSSAVAKAFQKLENNKNEDRYKQLLADLQATKINDLWPEAADMPPPTKEGIVWHAANSLVNKPAARVDMDIGKPTMKRKGRTKGCKGWREDEYDKLLDVVEKIVPTGSKQWELVAESHYKNGFSGRSGESLKKRFEQLCFTTKPTGSAFIPRIIARAKDIKEAICREEVIGYSMANDSDESSPPSSLASVQGTKLVDDKGNFRRPVTKKRQSSDVSAALTELACDQKATVENFAKNLTASLDRIVDTFAMDTFAKDGSEIETKVNGLEAKIGAIEAKLEIMGDMEKKLDKIEEIENKLDKLINHLMQTKDTK